MGKQRAATKTSGGQRIAVVGLGCRYPGASSAAELWQNILARRQQFRPMPDVRLPLSEYQDADPRTPDKTYGRQAAVIDGYDFDWAAHRIPKGTAEATDIAHWLALDTALQMLDDAGYDAARLPRETTQVIVGNTLTGEFTRSNTLRLRWPFVRKSLRAAAPAAGLPAEMLELLEQHMETVYKSPFAAVNEDTLAGGLANTIAGRIGNYLNLNGGGYTVDGACCASLIAVYSGALSLAAGHSDFVIAGGVDISLDPFELIGFAKTGALTPTMMRVYDSRGNGFIPGEGCGFVGLKRLEDAHRDGDKVYAVLDGWGMSSDGRGGITAPSVAGQHLSLARAYRQARVDPGELDFIEGHGTGTALGDKTELLAMAKTLAGGKGAPRHCGVTSFKSIVGHTKAAAGIGAFIKGVMAVNQRVLPPTAGCEQAHAVFAGEGRSLYPLLRGERKPADAHVRAGVSAMGFGGINVHVTLASPDAAPAVSLLGTLDARSAMASPQATELFVLAAHDAAELQAQVTLVRRLAQGMSLAELADLAAYCARLCDPAQRCRAAIVAATPAELEERLDGVLEALRSASPAAQPRVELDRGFAIGQRAGAPRIGFVFPGQGSQQLGMARALVERHGWARELVAQAEQWASEVGTPGLGAAIWPNIDRLPHQADREPYVHALRQTEMAQPAITLAALLWLRYMAELGLRPDCVLGHSLGELTAFHAAGAFSERELVQLAVVRGQAMAARGEAAGAMASLGCTRARAEALLQQAAAHGYAVLANVNSDAQMIVSGEVAAIDAVLALAEGEGVPTHRLAVSNAFHSRFVADAARHLREHAPIPPTPAALRLPLLSGCDARPVDMDCDLHRHFGEQVTRPVEFVAAAAALAARAELVFEVGPGRVLSNLMARIAAASAATCLPLEAEAESFTDMNRALACAHVYGADLAWDALYASRVVRAFVPASQRQFIVNPCERPLAVPAAMPAAALAVPAAATPPVPAEQLVDAALAHFQDYLARRGPFLAEVIRADLRNAVAAPGAAVAAAPPDAAMPAPPRLPAGQAVAGQAVAGHDAAAAGHVRRHAGAREAIIELVAGATGFAPASLSLAMTMGDDLNLDSIKAGDIIARVAQQFGLAGRLDPADFTHRPLADLVAHIDAALPGSPPAVLAPVADPRALLRRTVARVTGFAETSIDLSMTLVDDLNLDSIKAGALIGEVAVELGIGARLDASELMAASLQAIAARMDALLAAAAPAAEATSPRRAAEALLIDALANLTGFERSRITPAMRMVDDLNLDSIKAGVVLAEVTMQLGLGGRVDAGARAGDSIGEIAQWLDAQLPSVPAVAVAPEAVAETGMPDWARAYVLALEYGDGETRAQTMDLGDAVVYLQCTAASAELAAAVAHTLAAAGARVLQGAAPDGDTRIDHYVAILPRATAIAGLASADAVPALIAPLHQAAEAARRSGSRSLSFVQFGLGAHLRGQADAVALDTSCAQAFAASVHLERPDLSVRVLDFDPAVADARIAQGLCEGLAAAGGYRAWYFDADGGRAQVVPRLLESSSLPPRSIDWSDRDVVLVTGGGKGITAELAFAFAQRTGTRMALVGSSVLERGHAGSAEVEATLARFAAAGLQARYYACDLGDAQAVAGLVAQVNEQVGAITGLVHGAGSNTPRRVEQVTPAQALDEVRPKLCGLLALCAALDPQPLKLVVGLGSIIGVTGMPGNAWYAFSNQALDVALANVHARHPATAVLTLAYSVWAEVGMGARLGSIGRLAQQGISAISPAAGVEQFLALALGEPPARQVVVAGRLGGLDTWRPDRSALHQPACRFLEQVAVFEPGVEAVSRVRLTLENDPYLRDHYYRGVYLFPTVFGLEAMAQVALAVAGGADGGSLAVERVRLERPIVVDGSHGTTIELRAMAQPRRAADEPLRVTVDIYTEQTGYRRAHFSGEVVLESLPPVHDAHLPVPEECIDQLDPLVDLYGGLLFQGEVFQRLRSVHDMDRSGSQTTIERRFDARYFAAALPLHLTAGDPAFRDGLLQTAQLSEQGQFLPVGIDRVEIHDRAGLQPGLLQVRNRITDRGGDSLACDVTAYTADGRIVERLLGYRLKRVHLDRSAPLPEDWRDPTQRDQRMLEDVLRQACAALGVAAPTLALAFAPHLSQMDRVRRRLSELPLFFDAVSAVLPQAQSELPDQLELHWDEAGKPILFGLGDLRLGLSLSHDASHCLTACGSEPLGCDIEPIVARAPELWHALLGDARMPLLEALKTGGDDLHGAGTRLWCAIEAARKALGAGVIMLRQLRRDGAAVAFSARIGEAGDALTILTFPMTLTRPRPKMFAISVTPAVREIEPTPSQAVAPAPAAAIADDSGLRLFTAPGPHGETFTACRFRVPFKDITSPRHGLKFPVFADWMGNLRELSIVGIARELVPDFASGNWGMVTNHSDMTVVGEAGCLDLIEGRLWVSRVYGKLDSSVDMHFDWVRIADDGSQTRVAYCNMATTWVAIKGHGVVELAPFPEYLRTFTRAYLPRSPLPAPPAELRRPMPETLARLALAGPTLYTAPAAPRVEPELLRQVFSTSLAESNLVGNIYFSSYYHWQGRLIDRSLFKLAPALFRADAGGGSLKCIRSSIQHLREAMPFDDIEVVMALKELYATGFRVHFEYHHLSPSQQRTKLAVGQADCVWVEAADPGRAAPLPAEIREGLHAACRGSRAVEAIS